MKLISGQAATRVLESADAHVVVPQVGGTAERLLRAMARFSEGEEHRVRRAQVIEVIDGLDTDALERRSHQLTAEILASSAGPIDLMEAVARIVPLTALVEALDAEASIVEDMIGFTRSVAGDGDPAAAADRLFHAISAIDPERGMAQLSVIFQACDSVVGLIGGVLVQSSDDRGLDDVLDHSPPVRVTLRQVEGRHVRVDLTGLAFGAGRHRCPGADVARALARGVLEAIDRPVDYGGGYEDRPNLRVPTGVFYDRTVD